MRCALLGLALAFVVLPLFAQEDQRPDPEHSDADNLKTPTTWTVRLDRPNDDVVIGADPEAIFYHPASTAEGAYRVEVLMHLFDPGGRNEAFGLFLGGQNLDADDIAYDYFLLRNSGQFLIKRRTGSGTSTIKGWTAHDAIMTYGSDTESSVPNTLAVEVGAEDVGFFVNGEEVARLPRSEVHTDGIVGLRVNHALNVHVEAFSVTGL